MKPPYFDPKTRRLLPCGELTLVSATIKTCGIMLSPRLIWVDEAGIQWNISRSNFIFDIEPMAWPLDVPAVYAIGHGSGLSNPIPANSYAEAVEKLKNSRWVNETTIKLIRVCGLTEEQRKELDETQNH